MENYSPLTIDAHTLEAIIARVDRYLNRHGGKGTETPIPPDQFDDVRQGIIAEWWGDDWSARELASLQKRGRTLFDPSLSDVGQHLRAVLFHCGRARRRNWRAVGATERVADKRRDPEGFDGVGSASRAADPARLVAAVESVSGELVLSKQAQRARARRGLPMKYSGGISAIPVDAPTAFRIMKRRNAKGVDLLVVARHEDRTEIEFRQWVRHNFERVGKVSHRIEWHDETGKRRSVPNPRRQPTRKRLPTGTSAATIREALVG